MGAAGYLLATSTNLGPMSGALKYAFDATYDDALNVTRDRPYGVLVHGARLLIERPGEIGPEVLDALASDTKPQKARRHRVGVSAPTFNQRLDAAEAGRMTDHPERLTDPVGRRRVGDDEADHCTEAGIPNVANR